MIRGRLFSRFYLEDGIRQTEAFAARPAAEVAAFAAAVRCRWDNTNPHKE